MVFVQDETGVGNSYIEMLEFMWGVGFREIKGLSRGFLYSELLRN